MSADRSTTPIPRNIPSLRIRRQRFAEMEKEQQVEDTEALRVLYEVEVKVGLTNVWGKGTGKERQEEEDGQGEEEEDDGTVRARPRPRPLPLTEDTLRMHVTLGTSKIRSPVKGIFQINEAEQEDGMESQPESSSHSRPLVNVDVQVMDMDTDAPSPITFPSTLTLGCNDTVRVTFPSAKRRRSSAGPDFGLGFNVGSGNGSLRNRMGSSSLRRRGSRGRLHTVVGSGGSTSSLQVFAPRPRKVTPGVGALMGLGQGVDVSGGKRKREEEEIVEVDED
ncbi:hypothetical protein V5O48_005666 [Marasmius crinis-equi]|uniref:Uncharacterized protein n=1 Tax=Marasmius crinis-equi TaxID=585013 RepID=A0ABR3FLS4_9AGAR